MINTKIESNTLLWSEEVGLLKSLAAEVKANGVVVEIGTAYGASALIINEATRKKNVSIYSIDKVPFVMAKNYLRDTRVHLINANASRFADQWQERVGRPIDLLFIDGDHNFNGIYNDFFKWIPWVNKSKIVLFHDYDPAQRGGIAHFAVRIFIETLIDAGILDNCVHRFKLFWGEKNDKEIKNLPIESFVKKLLQIQIEAALEVDQVFSQSFEDGIDCIVKRTGGMDSFVACLAVEYALKNNFEYLEQKVHSKNKFRQWAEMLSVYEHAGFHPEKIFSTNGLQTDEVLNKFSSHLAQWQIKIKMLSMILRSLVSWNP